MDTTFERLQAILVKHYKLAPETLTLDAPLDSLGLDSLGVVELLWNVEDEFKVALPSEPVPLRTVGVVVLFIDALIQAQRGAGVRAGVAAIPGLDAT